jgi:hypothetical protein
MSVQRALVSLVLAASVALSLAQPGLNLPPSGQSGFARGRVEDVRRVGAFWPRADSISCSCCPCHPLQPASLALVTPAHA